MPDELHLTNGQWEKLWQEAERLRPEEACGLLAGKEDRVLDVIPVANSLHSPVRFRMEPVEQLKAFQQMDERELELLGIYHSHPLGPVVPSKTDIEEAYYPEAVYLIISAAGGKWLCRGFRIQNGSVSDVQISIEPG